MQTFRRYSAALKAAGERDIIRLQIAGETLFVVPGEDYRDACEDISIITHEEPKGSQVHSTRNVSGHISPRHLKRLGNANWALNAQEIRQRLDEPDGEQRYFRRPAR